MPESRAHTCARGPLAVAIGLAMSLLAGPAGADTTQENLAKYTRLRQRLSSEFTSVGPEQGQSQPAQERNEQIGLIRWADSTIFLGWYIGLLASEYHLLANPDQFPGADSGDAGAASATLDELYHALLAMERLDELADASFPEPCSTTPSLNGFFIRDDIPANFHERFPSLGQTMSDFIDPTLTNKEMSQDQVYHVYIGLALVKRFVPASVTVRGKPLRAWSIEQARRIGEHFAKDLWVIRNPACDRNVNRGEQAIGYSGGTKHALDFLTDGAFVPTTLGLSDSVWNGLVNPNSPVYDDEDNLHMALAIAAVGDGWEGQTAQEIATLAELEDWPLYPLLHRALHGDAASGFCNTYGQVNPRARVMLDELPQDAEPAHPTNGPAPHGFTTTNRFIRPKAQAYVGAPGGDGLRYSGVDYLLLHNLYAIATPGTWQGDSAADPCAVTEPGADAGAGDDAGNGGGGGGNGGSGNGNGGCGIASSSASFGGWMLLAVVASIGSRRRHP